MWLGPFTSVTLWIIALVVAVSLWAFQRPSVLQSWALRPWALQRSGKYYTLLTSGLIHADWGHLAFNMLTLYFFGAALENYYELQLDSPGLYMALLFFSGIVVANLPSYIRQRNDPNYATLGASGGVEAVVFATILLNPMAEICLYFAICLPGVWVGIGYLAYSYFLGRQMQGNVNHEAHIAGALYGLLWQTVLTPSAWQALIDALL